VPKVDFDCVIAAGGSASSPQLFPRPSSAKSIIVDIPTPSGRRDGRGEPFRQPNHAPISRLDLTSILSFSSLQSRPEVDYASDQDEGL